MKGMIILSTYTSNGNHSEVGKSVSGPGSSKTTEELCLREGLKEPMPGWLGTDIT